MIIVLDKLCLMGVIAVSFYTGYKVGSSTAEMKQIFGMNN